MVVFTFLMMIMFLKIWIHCIESVAEHVNFNLNEDWNQQLKCDYGFGKIWENN